MLDGSQKDQTSTIKKGYLYFLVMLETEINNFIFHFIGIAKMWVERFDV